MGIPVPLKGETYFSYLTRTILRSGATATMSVARRSGLPCGSLWSPLGVGISAFYRMFPDAQAIIQPKAMVWRHTTAPLLVAFSNRYLSPESKAGFAASVVGSGGWRSRNGAVAGNRPSGLRECPECVASDTESFGVPYWHREHQIRAVARCWRHDVVLREHRWLPGARFIPELPGFGRYGKGSITEQVGGSLSAEKDLWLAKAFASILDSDESLSHADIRGYLTGPAIGSGVILRGRPSIERAFTLVVDSYGVDYLLRLDLPVNYTQHSAMRYSRALSKSPGGRDPLATLLLAGALSVPYQQLSRRPAVVSPPEVERQEAAEFTTNVEKDAIQKVLADCGYVLGRSAVAMNLSRSELIRTIKEAGIQCPIVVSPNAKFNETTIRAMMSDARAGLEWSELKEKYGCSEDILQVLPVYDPTLRDAARFSRNQKRIENFRKVVVNAVRAGQSRGSIRKEFPTELSYLGRHDHGWLGEQLALVPRRASSRPAKGTGRGQGPADSSEDTRILAMLESALQSARALEPPRRVTKTLLVQMAGLKTSIFSKLGKGRYVRVDAFLVAHEEPYGDFIGRKLAFAFKHMEAESPTRAITVVRLRLASGLAEGVLVSQKTQIGELLRASPLVVSPWAAPWLREARLTRLSA